MTTPPRRLRLTENALADLLRAYVQAHSAKAATLLTAVILEEHAKAHAGQPAGVTVLVCGGRALDDQALVWGQLDALDGLRGPVACVIHGGAKGADALAAAWAKHNAVHMSVYRADWKRHGKAAGPIRNKQMIDECKPDLVLAFPGGTGTADLVRQARAAGIEVIET